MDAAEYKHVVLGLVFLKYVSDVFTKRHTELEAAVSDPASDYYMPTHEARAIILSSRDEYASEGVFWVPDGARWEDLRAAAKQPDIGSRIDSAMDAIEKENPSLKGVLPKSYARRELSPSTLGGLIDTFSRDDLAIAEERDTDVLGRVFEYMLSQFASAEGKLGGEFFTPRSVVQLIVEMLEPFAGQVYDPACGSGGMFVQADRFIRAHGGGRNEISVFGQEQNPTTWRLAKMNLALRGIDANLGPQWGDSFANDLHKDLKADFIMANPPFNIRNWGGERLRDDPRWAYGTPPANNANYAWLQHMIHHLKSTGTMATVLSNGSLSSQNGGEGDIRRRLIEADLVEAVVSLPGQLFFTTQIPVSLWFVTKNKSRWVGQHSTRRERAGEVLFIDAREMGSLVSRTQKVLTKSEISRISNAYHAWRTEGGSFEPEAGFSAVSTLSEVKGHSFVLTPARYVGNVEESASLLSVDEQIKRISAELDASFDISARLQQATQASLQELIEKE